MITSKLHAKVQITLPQSVLLALGIAPGDEIAYAIHEGRFLVTKAPPANIPAAL
jgi:antitoxin PrlF